MGDVPVLLHDVDEPFCPECRAYVCTVYRAGFWCCSGCGLCVAPEVEGTGGLRVPRYHDDENTDGARRWAEPSEARAELETVLRRVRVEPTPSEFPRLCQHTARALQLAPAVVARARELAQLWCDARHRHGGRMPALDVAQAAVVYRARLEHGDPPSDFEVRRGACGDVRDHVRILRFARQLAKDVRLPVLSVCAAFVTRFCARLLISHAAEDAARKFLSTVSFRMQRADVAAAALLGLDRKDLRVLVAPLADVIGPDAVPRVLAARRQLRRAAWRKPPPTAAPPTRGAEACSKT